ncbi:MAG: Na-translocating system protein MpsC family protein [Planctomycetia bacterium]|nr:Na-translocating system protein MpsC family protein [Planctomycetia bacterium]
MDTITATLVCDDCDDKQAGTVAEQIARAICDFQHGSTGHTPTAVSVVLSEDTLVITLHEALTPAERAMAKSAGGAAKLQEFHRQLFANSSESLRQEIRRITGRQVREAAVEVEPTSGSIVHAFTTGTAVQVFLLAPITPVKDDAATLAATGGDILLSQ